MNTQKKRTLLIMMVGSGARLPIIIPLLLVLVGIGVAHTAPQKTDGPVVQAKSQDTGSESEQRLHARNLFASSSDENLATALDDARWSTLAMEEMSRRFQATGFDQSSALAKLLLGVWTTATNERSRHAAFELLRRTKSEAVARTLESRLFEPSTYSARTAAAIDLGRIGCTSSIPALVRAVREDKLGDGSAIEGYKLARHSICALARMGDAGVVSLLDIWTDEMARRWSERDLVVAMGMTKDTRFLPILFSVLDGRVTSLQEVAARSLGEIADKGALPVLRKHHEDANPAVRNAVVDAINRIEANVRGGKKE